jgi:uncharacterized protein YydD (DUF2326 family)
MLRKLSASHGSFKSLTFTSGLNLIVADRADERRAGEAKQAQRRTRNGAGKSSVVDLIHFLLGGKAEGALASEALSGWTFDLTLDVGPQQRTVQRSIADAKYVQVQAAKQGRIERITNAAWCQLLGEVWFGLGVNRPSGSASYRQLFSYFARRKRDGGYDDPTRTFRAQSSASIETALAELFGLDSELVRRLHSTKGALKQAQGVQRTLADLERSAPQGQRRVDLESQLAAQIAATTLTRDRLKERIDSFNVLPAFRELEKELIDLNQEMRDLSDQDVLDTESIEVNRRALEAEATLETPDLGRLFQEAHFVFPDIVSRRYDEVVSFHKRLIENRQAHLESEIGAARRRIEARQPLRQSVEQRRRQITAALRASGPADELLRLRDELAAREAELRGLQTRLAEARSLETRIEQLQDELEEAARALRQDRRERAPIVDEASRTFSEISGRLYENPGRLVISATDSGLRFLPTTPADRSAGVMSVEIFCFDLTIATLCSRRGLGPGFLIHDSHLFEAIDGRQFARALRIAAEFSEETGVQYIATLNSDELSRAEAEGGEDFSAFVREPKLSDTPEGGLFGIRFD